MIIVAVTCWWQDSDQGLIDPAVGYTHWLAEKVDLGVCSTECSWRKQRWYFAFKV